MTDYVLQNLREISGFPAGSFFVIDVAICTKTKVQNCAGQTNSMEYFGEIRLKILNELLVIRKVYLL